MLALHSINGSTLMLSDDDCKLICVAMADLAENAALAAKTNPDPFYRDVSINSAVLLRQLKEISANATRASISGNQDGIPAC